MHVPVYTVKGEKRGDVALGRAFSAPVRTDVIRRAVLAEASRARQPYGADPLAGKRTSAHYHGLRHYRYSMMNREMARMKRIHGRVGYLAGTARFVPQAVKGRKAHPPKTEKLWVLKVNKKERRLAFLSAISASVHPDYQARRDLGAETTHPLVIEDAFQSLAKTKDVLAALNSLGLGRELGEQKSTRAGKGKRRGRRYRRRKGLLIITTGGSLPPVPGTEVKRFADLAVSDIAPGGDAGRLCIWTRSAIEEAGKL